MTINPALQKICKGIMYTVVKERLSHPQQRIYLTKGLDEHRIVKKESFISNTVYTKAPILREGEKHFPKLNQPEKQLTKS